MRTWNRIQWAVTGEGLVTAFNVKINLHEFSINRPKKTRAKSKWFIQSSKLFISFGERIYINSKFVEFSLNSVLIQFDDGFHFHFQFSILFAMVSIDYYFEYNVFNWRIVDVCSWEILLNTWAIWSDKSMNIHWHCGKTVHYVADLPHFRHLNSSFRTHTHTPLI